MREGRELLVNAMCIIIMKVFKQDSAETKAQTGSGEFGRAMKRRQEKSERNTNYVERLSQKNI